VVGFLHEEISELKKRIELIEGIPAMTMNLYHDGEEITNSVKIN
jgi:hypothetical protein